jgi:hypothetical protein
VKQKNSDLKKMSLKDLVKLKEKYHKQQSHNSQNHNYNQPMAREYIQVNPDMKNAPINVRIASMQGRVLLERVVDNFDTKLNLEMLPSEGYYIVTVTYSTGSVFSSKVLLKKE